MTIQQLPQEKNEKRFRFQVLYIISENFHIFFPSHAFNEPKSYVNFFREQNFVCKSTGTIMQRKQQSVDGNFLCRVKSMANVLNTFEKSDSHLNPPACIY